MFTDRQVVGMLNIYLEALCYMDEVTLYQSIQLLDMLYRVSTGAFQRACVMAVYNKIFTGEKNLCCLFD